MQENQKAIDDENVNEDDGADRNTVIARRTGVAIAIWVFLLAGGVLAYVSAFHVNANSVRVNFFIGSLFSIAALIVVVVQAAIYDRQAKALDAQLRISDKTFKLAQSQSITTQRAYLMIAGGHVSEPEEGKPMSVYIVFKNSGNTPANNIQTQILAEVRKVGDNFPKLKEITNSTPITPGGSVAPGQPITRHIKTHEPLTIDQVQRLVDKDDRSVNFFAWGVLTYWDIFGNERHTRFCIMKKHGELIFGPAGTENEAD